MDDRQFDTWTRLLATHSRRNAISLLLAGLAGGSLAAIGRGDALAQVSAEACGKQGDRCKTNSDCCNNFKCKNDKCREKNNNNCGKDGDRCKKNNDCCSNFECKNDKCRKKDNNNCGKQGDRCKKNNDCCNNYRCKNDTCRKKN